jgi:hypothetical protein
MKFSMNKYFQIFNRVSPGYAGLVNVVIINLYIGVPVTYTEPDTGSNAPTLYRTNAKVLQVSDLSY